VAAHINNPVVPSAVRWLWLGDYSEQLARWAMGSPEEAVLFLRECLNQPQKLNTTVILLALIIYIYIILNTYLMISYLLTYLLIFMITMLSLMIK